MSAAAMERSGNYRSCHDNIVKFQILDEIESLFDLRVDCGGEDLGKRLQDLFKRLCNQCKRWHPLCKGPQDLSRRRPPLCRRRCMW